MRSLSWPRVLSMVLAGAYVVSAFTRSGQLAGFEMIYFCVPPVACIWFPEALGEFVGGRITRITNQSPPALVSVLGWVVLLVPLLVGGMWYLEGVQD